MSKPRSKVTAVSRWALTSAHGVPRSVVAGTWPVLVSAHRLANIQTDSGRLLSGKSQENDLQGDSL